MTRKKFIFIFIYIILILLAFYIGYGIKANENPYGENWAPIIKYNPSYTDCKYIIKTNELSECTETVFEVFDINSNYETQITLLTFKDSEAAEKYWKDNNMISNSSDISSLELSDKYIIKKLNAKHPDYISKYENITYETMKSEIGNYDDYLFIN